MTTSDRPAEVCPKCGAEYRETSFANGFAKPAVDWFHCDSTVEKQSDRCKLIVAERENARLTAELQAAQGKLAAIEDALTGTNSDKIECSIVWEILHPTPPAPPAGEQGEGIPAGHLKHGCPQCGCHICSCKPLTEGTLSCDAPPPAPASQTKGNS